MHCGERWHCLAVASHQGQLAGLAAAHTTSCRRAVINRFGFNSAGVDVVGANLAAFRDRTNYEPARSLRPGLVGVNLGKNKASSLVAAAGARSVLQASSQACSRAKRLRAQVTDDAAADYVLGLSKLAQHADYLVVNVSSPNTPGGASELGQ